MFAEFDRTEFPLVKVTMNDSLSDNFSTKPWEEINEVII